MPFTFIYPVDSVGKRLLLRFVSIQAAISQSLPNDMRAQQQRYNPKICNEKCGLSFGAEGIFAGRREILREANNFGGSDGTAQNLSLIPVDDLHEANGLDEKESRQKEFEEERVRQ